jgi:hypothetical protein
MLFQRASLSCKEPYWDQLRSHSVLSWPSISVNGLGVKLLFANEAASTSEYT